MINFAKLRVTCAYETIIKNLIFHLITGCTNEFVNVEYLSTTSTITCAFLDQTDTSIKSCSVMYGQQCEEMLIPGSQQNSTAEDPYSITLSVPENINCYEITASNGSFTIVVEGTNFVNAGKHFVQSGLTKIFTWRIHLCRSG